MSKNRADSGGQTPARILVPIDGSQNSIRALKKAITLTKTYESELLVMNVISAPNILLEAPIGFGVNSSSATDYYSEQEVYANRFLEDAISVIKSEGVGRFSSEVVRASKSVVEEIIETASKRKVDLIVIGTRGVGGFRKLLQGSVSSGVVTHASCDVLVVR